MATKYFFDNKTVSLPGAYSTVKAMQTTSPIAASYGRVLVIDNGKGAGWGGGAGISGEQATGGDAIYRFNSLANYQSFLKGGIFWKAAEALFKPAGGLQGASEVIHVRAAETTKAVMTFTATGGGTAGGTFKVNTKDEGLTANGVVTGTGSSMHLDKGYGFSIDTGVRDSAKWIFKIYRGTWKGDYTDGIAFDEVVKAETKPELIVASPEFDNIQTLIDWANTDRNFNVLFELDSTSAKTGTGAVTSADITGLNKYVIASGGTETYSTTHLDSVLENIEELDFALLLNDQNGADFDSAYSSKMFIHLRDTAKFMKFMVVGGGADEDAFTATDGSIDAANYFDDIHAIVVHGDVKKRSSSKADGFRVWNTLISAAYVTGRIAGLAPQVPCTNKQLDIDGVVHQMKKSDKEFALENGVLCINFNEYTGSFNILQGINTIQNNTIQINPNATSFSIQIMRIVSQINRELVVNVNQTLLSDENGVNVNTLSAKTLENWTRSYLQKRVATIQQDNLIVGFSDVVVERDEDSYFVNYKIEVNGEITKVFFTGFMVN